MAHKNPEADALIKAADAYALMAINLLFIEPRLDPLTDLMDDSLTPESKKAFADYFNRNAVPIAAGINYFGFRVHYLFPNLNDAESLLVKCALISAEFYRLKLTREKGRLQAIEDRKKLSSLHKKLTAVQLDIIESEMFAIPDTAGDSSPPPPAGPAPAPEG